MFSILCSSNYCYNKWPLIVDNLIILTIHQLLFSIISKHSISLQWEINKSVVPIYRIDLKNGQNISFYIEIQWYSYFCNFSDWSISYHFSYKFRTYAFFVLSVTIFLRKSNNSINSVFDFDTHNHSLFDICWSSRKKNMSIYINNQRSITLSTVL